MKSVVENENLMQDLCRDWYLSQHAPWACRSPRINPPAAAAAAVQPFYSSFDWLDYGLILLVVNPT
jgi:hypothetical protein